MNVDTTRLTGLCLLVLLTAFGHATAAGPDLRVVEAMAQQDAATVRALIDKGTDVNAARGDGVTALHWAAHWDDAEAADILLGAGANVNAADDRGVTPLARACENASAPMVSRLLEAGADPNADQANGLTPLMTAARTGNSDVVRTLLSHGAEVNAETATTHETALMWAVAEGRIEIVRTLIDNGADVHPTAHQAYSPLIAAARNGDIATAKVLLAAGADINGTGVDGSHSLPYAIVSGQTEFAHFLLEQGADPNGAIDGVTALHTAAGPVGTWLKTWYRRWGGGGGYFGGRGGAMTLEERVSLVNALLDKGADPNVRTTTSEMAKLGFLRNGAYDTFAVGTGDLAGATPLWVAAWATNPGAGSNTTLNRIIVSLTSAEVIRSLLAAGARADLTPVDGTTALMAAAGCGHDAHVTNVPRGPKFPEAEEAVAMLIEAGVDVNAKNEGDFTALHCAAFSGVNEIVRTLVEHGSDINARDWRGRTPFRLAEGAKQTFHYQEWPQTAVLLQELGADTSLGIPGTVHERLGRLAADQDQ
jgi:ankyrin repeat protein